MIVDSLESGVGSDYSRTEFNKDRVSTNRSYYVNVNSWRGEMVPLLKSDIKAVTSKRGLLYADRLYDDSVKIISQVLSVCIRRTVFNPLIGNIACK